MLAQAVRGIYALTFHEHPTMHAPTAIMAVLLMGMTSCKESRLDIERKAKERGEPIESSFMTLEQARKEYGGDETTLELMFAPAGALQLLREPVRIQAALSIQEAKPVFHEVPYALAHRLVRELNKFENYGAPYLCGFHEDFILQLDGGTKELLFTVPRFGKLAYSPALGEVLSEIFDELKQETTK